MPDQFTEDIVSRLGISAPSDSQYSFPDQSAEILSSLGLSKKKEDHSWPVAVGIKAAANTTPGLALRATGSWDYEDEDLGLIGNTAAGIGSFLFDPATYALGGVGGMAGKQLARGALKETTKRMIEHGAVGAIQLGGLEAMHDPLRQYIETGEVDTLQTAANTARSAVLGAGFGPLANIGGPGRAAAEVALLGAGEPLLHGEAPSVDSALSGLATVVGLKGVNALVKIGWDGRQKLIDSRNGRREAGLADAAPSVSEFEALGLREIAKENRDTRNAVVDAAEAIQKLSGDKPLENAPPEKKSQLEVEPVGPEPDEPIVSSRKLTGERDAAKEAEIQAREKEQAKTQEGQIDNVLGATGKPVETDAEAILKTEGEVQVGRDVGQGGQDQGGQNLRRQIEESQGGGQAPEGGLAGPPPPDTVALKNEFTDQMRANLGLPPRVAPMRQADPDTFNLAMGELAADPMRTDTLIAEMKAKPRAGTSVESMLLLHRESQLDTNIRQAVADIEAARQAGDAAAEARADSRLTLFSTQMEELIKVIESAGTEWGRIGHLRQVWMAEDFSLHNLVRIKRAAVGRPLTEQEHKELVETAKQAEAKSQAQAEQEIVDIGKGSMQRMQEKAAKKKEKLSKSKKADEVRKEIDDLWKELGGKYGGGQMFASPLGPFLAGVDGVRLAGKYIKLGMAKFADFVSEVKARMGAKWEDSLVPDLQKAWDQAVEDAKPKPKRQIQNDRQLSNYARKVAEFHVERGVETLKDLIDAVHDDLRRVVDPGITRKTAIEAFSGYGIYTPPTDDPIKRALYDLRRQGQEVAKLMDIKEGKAPSPTGKGRPEASETERHLTKKVRQGMRKAGMALKVDPAKHLKTVVESQRTRLRNEIADLDLAIKTLTRLKPRAERKKSTDPEVQRLEAKRNQRRKDYDAIFGKRGMTDEQRLNAAIAVQRRIARETRSLIASGKLAKPKGMKVGDWAGYVSTEYTAARAEARAARAELKHLRDLANPKKTPEQKAEAAYHAMLRRRIADYEQRLLKQDFAPRERKLPPKDSKSEQLRFELEQIKLRFYRGVERERLKNRTVVQKIFGTGAEAANMSRAMMTSMDFSAVLRQGGFYFAAHPIRSIRAMPEMFRAFFSEAARSRAAYEIANRPNAKNGLYKTAKIEFTDPRAVHLSKQEEAFMSRLVERYPRAFAPVTASARAYITFLNRVRADLFDSMAATMGKGGTIGKPEAMVLGEFVNAATGRGNLGRFTQASTFLATTFFAPRYVVSRFQMILLQPLWRGNLSTRTAIVKEYARALIGLGVFYGASNFALSGLIGPPGKEWNIETDPRSSDFGKVRIGITRIDPLAGFQQAAVLTSRLLSGETKTPKGKIRPIRGDKVRFGQDDAKDVMARFLRTKLSPPIATMVDVASGRDVVGQKVTPQSILMRSALPITFQDIYETMIAQGVPAGTAMALLNIFGMNVQTHNKVK